MQGKGEVWWFLFPIFTMGNAIGSPTLKCFRFIYAKSWHFRSANVSLESSIRGLFGDIFSLKIKVGVYEKLASITTVLRKLPLHHLQSLFFRTGLRLTLDKCALVAGLDHSVGRSWCGVINYPADSRRPLSPSLSNWPVRDFRSNAALFPNYFGQTC